MNCRYLTAREVSDCLNVDVQTIQKWVRDLENPIQKFVFRIDGKKLGGIRIHPSFLELNKKGDLDES